MKKINTIDGTRKIGPRIWGVIPFLKCYWSIC